jgi:hypothetical protein
MPSQGLPKPARVYLWLMAGAAGALLVYWALAWRGRVAVGPVVMALLVAAGTVAQHYAVHIAPRRKVDVSIAVYFACLLLAGAPVGMALVGASQALGQSTLALRRNPATGKRLRTPAPSCSTPLSSWSPPAWAA